MAGIVEEENETNEQLTEKLVIMVKDCGADITAEDISVCHRAGSTKHRDGGSRVNKRPVLCHFVSRKKNEDIMKRKKTLRNFEGDKYKYTYINDHLTSLRAKLFTIARNHPSAKNANTHNGRIVCRMKDEDKEIYCILTLIIHFKF